MRQAGHERRTGVKATGPNAAALKYDILSAMGAHACAGDRHRQRLVLRLITLIVARYNWIADEIAVGQREIAAPWSFDERSVKRDLARLREMGWLVQKRAAARGRVAVHGLDLTRILAETSTNWAKVGTDFVERMSAGKGERAPAPSNVISFPAPRGEGLWPYIAGQLHRENPHAYGAWFASVRAEEREDGTLRLIAPSRFHADYLRTNFRLRLERMAQAIQPGMTHVEIIQHEPLSN